MSLIIRSSFFLQLKPEQVQAVKEAEEVMSNGTPTKRDRLQYGVGDIITVLDRRPIPDNPVSWKGILNNGKIGFFNPANTVAYLGTSVPSIKSTFQRGGWPILIFFFQFLISFSWQMGKMPTRHVGDYDQTWFPAHKETWNTRATWV